MARIGLLAGSGNLPLIFTRSAKEKGDTVIVFGLKGITDGTIEKLADRTHWLDWGSMQKALFLLATERIGSVVMLGKLKKGLFFKNEEALDEQAKNVLKKIQDKKDSAIFGEAAKILGKLGVKIIDPTLYLKNLIPEKGVITNNRPSEIEDEDIKYGSSIAKKLAGFEIGQAVVVKNKTVIAVETLEGTDGTILRAGNLTDGGFTVIKMARPDQDMRFDIPVVGIDTIRAIVKARGRVLAMESGKMFLLDREDVIKFADGNNISIVAL